MSLTFKFVTLFVALTLGSLLAAAQNTALSVVLGEKQYYVGTQQKVNWYRAALICASRGMTLASIESATEYSNLSTYLFSNGKLNGQYWLSGNDLTAKNEHTWLDTGNVISYTNWATGEPSTTTANRCVSTDVSFKWIKSRCTAENYYICSRPLQPACGAYGTCVYNYNPYD